MFIGLINNSLIVPVTSLLLFNESKWTHCSLSVLTDSAGEAFSGCINQGIVKSQEQILLSYNSDCADPKTM